MVINMDQNKGSDNDNNLDLNEKKNEVYNTNNLNKPNNFPTKKGQ